MEGDIPPNNSGLMMAKIPIVVEEDALKSVQNC